MRILFNSYNTIGCGTANVTKFVLKLLSKLIEIAPYYSHARLFDKAHVKMEVVNGGQPMGQNLLGQVQVAHIGPGVVAACVAGAPLFNRRRVVPVTGIADIEGAVMREKLPVARIARGHDAIEHIGP